MKAFSCTVWIHVQYRCGSFAWQFTVVVIRRINIRRDCCAETDGVINTKTHRNKKLIHIAEQMRNTTQNNNYLLHDKLSIFIYYLKAVIEFKSPPTHHRVRKKALRKFKSLQQGSFTILRDKAVKHFRL